jgi:dipeptidyl aminopeptidase/acylaminoacyl peptidase
VVALEPPIDLVGLHGTFKTLSPDFYNYVAMGAPAPDIPEMAEILRRFSPLEYADRIKVPVYFITGTFDLFAPPQQSRLMYEALLKNGNNNVKFVILPQVGHFFEKTFFGYAHEEFLYLVQSWFDKKLRG